jgi:hypothetical protein
MNDLPSGFVLLGGDVLILIIHLSCQIIDILG